MIAIKKISQKLLIKNNLALAHLRGEDKKKTYEDNSLQHLCAVLLRDL